jgi:hypothetical protein
MRYSIISHCIILIATILCSNITSSLAQEMPVPVKLHVVLLKKVFTLSKNHQGKQIKILIVFTDASTAVKDEALKNFNAIGLSATACKIGQVAQEIEGVDAVYIAPGAVAAEKICVEKGILSITGIPSFTETGKITIAIGMEAGKPKVFFSASHAKAEKQEFISDLYKVAKVFQ